MKQQLGFSYSLQEGVWLLEHINAKLDSINLKISKDARNMNKLSDWVFNRLLSQDKMDCSRKEWDARTHEILEKSYLTLLVEGARCSILGEQIARLVHKPENPFRSQGGGRLLERESAAFSAALEHFAEARKLTENGMFNEAALIKQEEDSTR